jgi:putative membrane protein
MKMTRPLLFASALAIAMGVQAQGMGNAPSTSGATDSGSSSSITTGTIDKKSFATQAAQDGLAEVEIARLAEQRASDPAVKDFARQLVKEHSANDKQLKSIARSEGITLPKKLSTDDRKTRDELAKLSGQQFDQRFLQVQVQDHQKAIDLFQKQADNGSGKLQAYAKNTLPHLQMHLDTANRLSDQVGATSSGTAGSTGAGGPSGSMDNGSGYSK